MSLPNILHNMNREKKRQIILTTHSTDMLCDIGIDGREVLYITPGKDGSIIRSMYSNDGMREVLKAGVMPGEIAPFRDMSAPIPFGLGLDV